MPVYESQPTVETAILQSYQNVATVLSEPSPPSAGMLAREQLERFGYGNIPVELQLLIGQSVIDDQEHYRRQLNAVKELSNVLKQYMGQNLLVETVDLQPDITVYKGRYGRAGQGIHAPESNKKSIARVARVEGAIPVILPAYCGIYSREITGQLPLDLPKNRYAVVQLFDANGEPAVHIRGTGTRPADR